LRKEQIGPHGILFYFGHNYRGGFSYPKEMNKLNSGFSRVRDEDLDNKAAAIIAALTGNTNFPTPVPTLATLSASLAAFQTALALTKGQARDAQVEQTRAILTTQLDQLARNLELTTGVTDAALATTGFDIRQAGARTGAPVDAPANLRAKATGTMGSVQLLCDPVNRGKSYEAQYALDANAGPWTDAGTFGSTRKIIISGLTRGKDYYFRVRAIGPDGAGGWSDTATIMVT
jgi:hypothetical protein